MDTKVQTSVTPVQDLVLLYEAEKITTSLSNHGKRLVLDLDYPFKATDPLQEVTTALLHEVKSGHGLKDSDSAEVLYKPL